MKIKFKVKSGAADGELLGTVRAETVQEAASIFVRRQRRSAVAMRITGFRGMSGIFQAYVAPTKKMSGQTSFGEPFWIGEE